MTLRTSSTAFSRIFRTSIGPIFRGRLNSMSNAASDGGISPCMQKGTNNTRTRKRVKKKEPGVFLHSGLQLLLLKRVEALEFVSCAFLRIGFYKTGEIYARSRGCRCVHPMSLDQRDPRR